MRRALTTAAVAAVMTALAPALPAAAEEGSAFTRLLSGMEQTNGSDLHTLHSTDGGASWNVSWVVDPLPEWDSLPYGQWMSSHADRAADRGLTEVLFQREFWMPAGLTTSSLDLCVLADGAAEVRLNGTLLIDQGEPAAANAEAPGSCSEVVDGLRPGPNVLDFTVRGDGGPVGLAYSGDLSYRFDMDAPPHLVLPDDLAVDAQGPEGAPVHFQVLAVDSQVGQYPATTCTPASGSVFPPGDTSVTCTAVGHRGAETTGTFTVTVGAWQVADAPPVLQLPGDRTVNTDSVWGAKVRYEVSATDDGGTPSVTCEPPSGGWFRIGTTAVDCTATDAAGGTDTGSFAITVVGPVQRACDHLDSVAPTRSTYWLSWRLRHAGDELETLGRTGWAGDVRTLANRIQAAGGKYVSSSLHRQAVTKAEQIMAGIGC